MVIPFGWADALNMAHGSISESRKATTSRTHDTARPPMPMYQHRACPILDTGADAGKNDLTDVATLE